jgi:hypothetical protein
VGRRLEQRLEADRQVNAAEPLPVSRIPFSCGAIAAMPALNAASRWALVSMRPPIALWSTSSERPSLTRRPAGSVEAALSAAAFSAACWLPSSTCMSGERVVALVELREVVARQVVGPVRGLVVVHPLAELGALLVSLAAEFRRGGHVG